MIYCLPQGNALRFKYYKVYISAYLSALYIVDPQYIFSIFAITKLFYSSKPLGVPGFPFCQMWNEKVGLHDLWGLYHFNYQVLIHITYLQWNISLVTITSFTGKMCVCIPMYFKIVLSCKFRIDTPGALG